VLRGVEAFGRHGVLPEERTTGQRFLVDAVLGLDTRAAAAGDDLAATVDYGVLAQRLAAVVEGEPVRLLETLAAHLAEVCLASPAVQQVEITVHKPSAPIPVPFDDVAVTITRSRGWDRMIGETRVRPQ
jgi:dihydroneopterin aldolase